MTLGQDYRQFPGGEPERAENLLTGSLRIGF